MNVTAEAVESLTLNITEEIHVRASIDATFAALLEEIGPNSQGGDGKPMPMKLELWPGGRWYRDLGNQNGHFWGHVQAVKRPSLLEITGPLFMSAAVVSNVQYRLSEANGETLIKFRHQMFGVIAEDYRTGISSGWGADPWAGAGTCPGGPLDVSHLHDQRRTPGSGCKLHWWTDGAHIDQSRSSAKTGAQAPGT